MVINKNAADALAWRKGASSILIPNVLDFDNAPDPAGDTYTEGLKEALGFEPDDIIFLQPHPRCPPQGHRTRHPAGQYAGEPQNQNCVSPTIPATKALPTKKMLRESAEHEGVDLRFVSTPGGR